MSINHLARIGFFVLTALTTSNLLGVSLAQDHGHDHSDHGHETALSLDHGKKWTTDESLRKGMLQIQQLMVNRDKEHSAHAHYANDIGAQVKKQVAYMIDHCQLPAEADAVLHILISELLEGAESISAASPDIKGFEKIEQALSQYPEYFDHQGWPSHH